MLIEFSLTEDDYHVANAMLQYRYRNPIKYNPLSLAIRRVSGLRLCVGHDRIWNEVSTETYVIVLKQLGLFSNAAINLDNWQERDYVLRPSDLNLVFKVDINLAGV